MYIYKNLTKRIKANSYHCDVGARRHHAMALTDYKLHLFRHLFVLVGGGEPIHIALKWRALFVPNAFFSRFRQINGYVHIRWRGAVTLLSPNMLLATKKKILKTLEFLYGIIHISCPKEYTSIAKISRRGVKVCILYKIDKFLPCTSFRLIMNLHVCKCVCLKKKSIEMIKLGKF